MIKDLDILKTCAVTGHRSVNDDLNSLELREVFISLIKKGIDTFLIGMAVGFDTLCFRILEKLKEDFQIKLVACVPCINQDRNFTPLQKKVYRDMLKKADVTFYTSTDYTPYCMQKRNMFMVDNSSVLLAYLRDNKGGTFNTVKYAEKNQKQIIRI
ncbi:MAG: DUF1273 family protein [Clostridia bacterium]|nr:DUF1273 family protein [Clostridia bacterium]